MSISVEAAHRFDDKFNHGKTADPANHLRIANAIGRRTPVAEFRQNAYNRGPNGEAYEYGWPIHIVRTEIYDYDGSSSVDWDLPEKQWEQCNFGWCQPDVEWENPLRNVVLVNVAAGVVVLISASFGCEYCFRRLESAA